jgi:hypothetical protein
MARSVRKAVLETRTARLKMPVARKPMFIRIGPGLSLGYRRNQVAGTWVLRIADGKGGATLTRSAPDISVGIAGETRSGFETR